VSPTGQWPSWCRVGTPHNMAFIVSYLACLSLVVSMRLYPALLSMTALKPWYLALSPQQHFSQTLINGIPGCHDCSFFPISETSPPGSQPSSPFLPFPIFLSCHVCFTGQGKKMQTSVLWMPGSRYEL
jgi:hypothetical protein